MYKPRPVSVMIALVLAMGLTADVVALQRRTKRRKPAPDVISCGAISCHGITPSKWYLDFGERIQLTATAVHIDGEKLTYTWAATGGTIEGEGHTVDYIAPDVAAGGYLINAVVSDDYGNTSDCSITIHVGPGLEDP